VSRAASLGVGGFRAGDAAFTPDMWRRNPAFGVEYMGMSLENALRGFVETRWPFVRVFVGGAEKNSPPDDADALAGFIASEIV
jgi:hypothetical protein